MLSLALLTPLMAFVNIMPVGDSITATCHDPFDFRRGAYRVILQDDLQAAGIAFDMVGPNSTGCLIEGYDPNHAGYNGYRIEQLADLAPGLVQEYSPDVVFLLAGTNNHFTLPDMTFFREEYASLFDAFGNRPVYVATVPLFGYDAPDVSYWTKDFVDYRNQVMFPLMNRVIHELATTRPNVRVVEYFDAFDPEVHLTEDKIHPNRLGQQLLADLFWEAAFAFDFNRSGLLESSDVDFLAEAIRQGSSDMRFDVNRDGIVSDLDRDVWLKQYRRTSYGDTNLDGYFNSLDIVEVLQSGRYETGIQAAWQSGDWNGDGQFNSGDLVRALADGTYEKNLPAAQSADLPEPSLTYSLLGATLFALRRYPSSAQGSDKNGKR